MQFPLKLLLSMAAAFIALNRLPSSWARYLPPPAPESVPAANANAMSSTLMDANDSPTSTNSSVVMDVNVDVDDDSLDDGDTATATAAVTAGGSDTYTASDTDGATLEHIRRRREVQCPQDITDINIMHLPCDLDIPDISKYIENLPNQCICAYNARYSSEQDYRNFMILQLEGFFFGQYSERFKRFEVDPHEFDYRM
ncbi:uncharacterized protein LOC115767281 [Drosophila novamexicana]|uniref:uncharacterized protein LOC115767281 n=1 Tax=Drosophila novamexicana TaxID=47314 RepID=UPI0011E5EB81|nr:uncharacterized protein LOC115767281 [Drosophila novamexicana]